MIVQKKRMPETSREETREKLLTHCLIMFRQKGYDGTNLQEIAQKLGMTRPALYHYFKSKDEILFRAHETIMTEMLEHYRAASFGFQPVEKLWMFTVVHVRMQLSFALDDHNRGSFGIVQLIPNLGEPWAEKLRVIAAEIAGELRTVIRDGVEDGSLNAINKVATAQAILGMNQRTQAWYSSGGPLSVFELACVHADLAVRIAGGELGQNRAILQRLAERMLSSDK